jgi:plastocyanin
LTRIEMQTPMTRRRALLVGAGGLAAAILAACGGPAASQAAPGGSQAGASSGGGSGSGLRIRMIGDDAIGGRFEPDQLTTRVGDTIVWENTGATSHTATCDPDNPMDAPHVLPDGAEPFHSSFVLPGDTFEHTFDVAGDYTYGCALHDDPLAHLTITE